MGAIGKVGFSTTEKKRANVFACVMKFLGAILTVRVSQGIQNIRAQVKCVHIAPLKVWLSFTLRPLCFYFVKYVLEV